MSLNERAAIQAEFAAKVARQESGCHLWIGAKTGERGYGLFKGRLATHWALELAGLERPSSRHGALHSCDNPPCVNPDHLRWGTQKENSADTSKRCRFVNTQKEFCPQSHAYTEENTIYRRKANGWHTRRCRKCDIERKRLYRKAKVLAAAPAAGPWAESRAKSWATRRAKYGEQGHSGKPYSNRLNIPDERRAALASLKGEEA